MTKIRLVVSDLDGTLLNEHHGLNAAVAESIRTYIKQGGLFTIATGRNWGATKAVADELSIRLPLILCNGGVLADRENIYYQSSLSMDALLPVLHDAQLNGLAALLFEHDRVYACGNPDGARRFTIKEKTPCTLLPTSSTLPIDNILKVVLVGPYTASSFIWYKHIAGENEPYTTMQSEEDFFEIVPRDENKGKALLALAKQLAVVPEEILAIGNHMNDKEMLCAAGIGAAVANSFPALLSFADYVCQKAWGEGVMEAMSQFVY